MSPNANPNSSNLVERLRATVHSSTRLTLVESGVERLVHVCHGDASLAGWWISSATGTNMIPMLRNPSAAEEVLAGALVSQKLCLIHSEISEAMEGYRKGAMDDKLPHRPAIEVELADAVIRIADLAGALGLDLGGALVEKLAYNRTRADHKIENRLAVGGKKF